MGQIIKLDGSEYDVENLSDQAKWTIEMLQFADRRIKDLTNMQALLQRAKNSYIDGLSKEVLGAKTGFMFDLD